MGVQRGNDRAEVALGRLGPSGLVIDVVDQQQVVVGVTDLRDGRRGVGGQPAEHPGLGRQPRPELGDEPPAVGEIDPAHVGDTAAAERRHANDACAQGGLDPGPERRVHPGGQRRDIATFILARR